VQGSRDELREAHDILAEFYASRLAHVLDEMPAERAVLDLFAESVLRSNVGTAVGDIGCGTGRLTPYLVAKGPLPCGVDLSPEMVRIARRDHPQVHFEVPEVEQLPFGDASLAGVVCWYSLIFLAPAERPAAFAELYRVVQPSGYVVAAFKAGDGQRRRAGRSTGLDVEFDVYWLTPAEMEQLIVDAGFAITFRAGVPPEEPGASAQGYVLAQKVAG
jgi:ubiquinone/menaquinone biosynthesis C-methylase UbiE